MGLDRSGFLLALRQKFNNGIADAVSKYPDRFIGLAHVPQVGDEGLEELDRACQGPSFERSRCSHKC